MEAIRKIVTVKDNELRVSLPEHYNNKQVELIILPVATEANSQVQDVKTDYEKYYGSLKSGLTIEQIDEQIRTLRSEWERDIS